MTCSLLRRGIICSIFNPKAVRLVSAVCRHFLSNSAATRHTCHPQPENSFSSARPSIDKPAGSLFYSTTVAYHLPPLLRRACGRSTELAMISDSTGSCNQQLSGKIMALWIENIDVRNYLYIFMAYRNVNVCSTQWWHIVTRLVGQQCLCKQDTEVSVKSNGNSQSLILTKSCISL